MPKGGWINDMRCFCGEVMEFGHDLDIYSCKVYLMLSHQYVLAYDSHMVWHVHTNLDIHNRIVQQRIQILLCNFFYFIPSLVK